MAEEMEKAALFDFNLTLPAIALEFLLLMFALDKIYFTPLGKFMDDRDAWIRAQLEEVKDTSEEVKQLEEKAAAIMKAARAEVAAALNQMQKETSAELEKMILEEKNKVEKELIEALAALEKQKEEALQALDSQITLLAEEIVNKLGRALPPASSTELVDSTRNCFSSSLRRRLFAAIRFVLHSRVSLLLILESDAIHE
ncbi:hypothetical protein HPP92_016421 [Vanilla planifolia]|uniref:ATP synthase subunit b', chloroplastic n=1 Tax=Vanilla planifolia TaxID=51239 RepID=A0A835QES6_VANPL|nr:hypothetical protein HPP92_016421 [Vanilla planifolia]